MKGVRQAVDLSVCFCAKPNKGLSFGSPTRLEVGKGTRRELEKGTQRRQLAKGDAESQSTPDSRRDQSAWDRVQEQWWKTIQESALLVAFWKFREECTSASVYRCTGNAVSRNHPSCISSWPKPLLFVCRLFFFSHSLGCISCGHKEMCDTPIRTTRWITGQDRIVTRSW